MSPRQNPLAVLLGNIASEALAPGMTSLQELDLVVGGKVDIASIIAQSAGKAL